MRIYPSSKRTGLITTLTALVVAGAGAALAANVHLKGGANAEPTFTDGGLTLQAAGELAGLSFQDVVVNLSASANPTASCTNPAGQTQPPGQNPAPVTVTGAEAIPADAIQNGNTPFSVTTQRPTTPIPGAPDCPNPQWTEAITDMAFTDAVITVFQPAGTLVLTVTCTLVPPGSHGTSDGLVPASQVNCTSVQS